MNVERALEVIASHGGAAAAWPADERAGIAALAASDARVGAALAAARALDALLAAWAVDVVPRDYDAAALIDGAAAGARVRSGIRGGVLGGAGMARGWLAGAMLAAAVATEMVVLAPFDPGPAVIAGAGDAAIIDAAAQPDGGGDAEAFAMIFTTTADEDELI